MPTKKMVSIKRRAHQARVASAPPIEGFPDNPKRRMVMVRVPYYLSEWATNLSPLLKAKDVPEVTLDKRRAGEWVSKTNLIEQAIRDFLLKHDPTGEYSTFGER